MSLPPISQKFTVSGEKEYKAALTEINSGLSVLKSEMELTKSAFAGNEDSMASLSARADVLNRQILSQSEKVEKLRAALKASADSYGESDTRTQSWQIKLNKASTELNNLHTELDKTGESMEKAEEAMGLYGKAEETATAAGAGLGDVLNSIGGKFGIQLPEGLTKSANGLLTVNAGAAAAAAGIAAFLVVVTEAEKALKRLTDQSAASADDIMTLSLQTGLTTQTIQELKYSAELIDVPFETLQSSMAKMIRSMSEAKSGTGDAAEAFAKLRVSVTDSSGNLLGSEDVFNRTINALHNMSNATERDAASMAIFGRSAQDLNPLIVQGSSVLALYRKEAEDTGYVLSNDLLSSLGAVDDAHQRLINTQKAAKDKLAIEFAPALTKFYTELSEGWDKVSTDIEHSKVVDVFAELLNCVSALAPALAALGDVLGVLQPVFVALAVTLEGIAKAIALIEDTVDVLVGTFTLHSEILNKGLGLYGNSHYQQFTNGTDAYNTNVWDPEKGAWVGNGSANASGNSNFHGGLTWVGENGPEPVWLPQGARIGTAQDGQRMNSGGDVFNVTIDAKNVQEFNDIVRMARDARVTARMTGKTGPIR